MEEDSIMDIDQMSDDIFEDHKQMAKKKKNTKIIVNIPSIDDPYETEYDLSKSIKLQENLNKIQDNIRKQNNLFKEDKNTYIDIRPQITLTPKEIRYIQKRRIRTGGGFDINDTGVTDIKVKKRRNLNARMYPDIEEDPLYKKLQ